MFGCADSRDTAAQRSLARAGIGGIVLLGASPPADLGSRLRSVRAAAPRGWRPIIASDEEGGAVQRLAPLIYRLPAAETMGAWPDRTLRRTAKRYGTRMRALGVDMSLAPVADLRVPGSYIDRLGRAFSSDPVRVGRAVSAWSRGLSAAGVIPVVKHWPGHGHAADTHTQAARVPSYARLRRADLLPFADYAAAGHRAVMVAHVQSAGLTAAGEPATQSPRAIRILRRQAGPDAVIITDSLSMAAASSARGLSQSQAVVAALRAGVDWAMVCSTNTGASIAAVAGAIRSGELPRTRLERSLSRIHALPRP
jgi:beta-N-acetylhexosaminidase